MMRRVGITLPLALLALTVVQLRADAHMFGRWQGWLDQHYYLQSARAWAVLDFDPSQHHYPGGYSLLAAPFVYITPTQPFIIPDLVCAAASLLLFVRICRRLAPGLPAGDAVAGASFLIGTLLNRRLSALWAVPWTTTAEAPLFLLCLLMALRFAESGRLWRIAGLGFAAGMAAFVRPSDAAIALCACAIFCGVQLLLWRAPARRIGQCVIAATAGLGAGLIPAAATHLAIHGLSAGAYAAKSAVIGFEWRLIPLRWVTLAIDPRPLFDEGPGMAAAFPWFLAGCAGMVLAALRGWRGSIGPNALVAGAVVLYWCVYLAYRDLHAAGLWYFSNIHYFKWTFPFLVFWAVGLVCAAFEAKRRLPAGAAAAFVLLLFMWRPVFIAEAGGTESAQPFSAAMPGGLSPLHHAVLLQFAEAGQALYLGHAHLTIGGRSFANTQDFKIFPGRGDQSGQALIMPLRELPQGDAVLALPDGGRFAAEATWMGGHWGLVPGVPCLVLSARAACHGVTLAVPANATSP